MPLNNSIKRKLASLLSPWLVQDANLDLKLGFLRSHGAATNLTFDTSALNRELLDSSARFLFKEFKVERISVRASYWSVPALVVEVHGVHVVMELDEERLKKVRKKSNDTMLEERKKILAEMDPEGTVMHDALQKLSETNSSRSRKTSFLNVILERCQLQIHDINLHVRFPFANDSFGISFAMKEFSMGTSGSHVCIFRALIGAFIAPLADCSFSIDFKGFEVGTKKRDGDSYLINSVDLSTHLKFKDLQLVDCNLQVPKLIFSVTPAEFAIVFVFCTLLYSESNYVRSGRLLWNIAADRIGSLTSAPRFSLHKLVLMVCLWIKYVDTYQDLLLLVGYPEENILKTATLKVSEDAAFSALFKKKWRSLSEIEKKLPAEAIARARHIIRCRAALRLEPGENHYNVSLVDCHHKFYRRIILPMWLVWNIVRRMFNTFTNLLSLVIPGRHLKIGGLRVTSEYSGPQSCFLLSLGLVLVSISPLDRVQSLIYGDQSTGAGRSSLGLNWICVSAEGFVLLRAVNFCEQSFMVSCGQLKIISSSFTEDALKNKRPEGYIRKEVNDLKREVLRSEPASMFYSPENCTTVSVNEIGGASCSILQDRFGEMWSNWKKYCGKFEGGGVYYLENPWMFCEVKRSVTNQTPDYMHPGFLKCSSTLGKLSLLLDYSIISSTAVLVRQIENAHLWVQDNSTNIVLPTPVSEEISEPLTWDDRCKSYVGELENGLLSMLPPKYIQMSIFITGPLLRLSLRKELLYSQHINGIHIAGQDENHFVVDVRNIELAVWPTLSPDSVITSDWQGLHDAGQASFLTKEHQEVSIPKFDSERFTSQGNILLDVYLKVNGLEAFLDNSAENKKYGMIMLNPTTIKLSSVREDVNSFDSEVIAISVTWQAMTAGISVCLFMDELFVLSKVLIDIQTAISCAICEDSSYMESKSQELLRRESLVADTQTNTKLVARTKSVPLTFTEVLCVVNGKFENSSVEIVLQNSRNTSCCRKMVLHDLPDYGTIISTQKLSFEFRFEGNEMEVNTDLFDIRCIIFRDQSELLITSEYFQVRDMLKSLSCLYEMSVSHFASALRLSNFQQFPNEIEQSSNDWIVANITASEIYMAGLSVKEILIGVEKTNRLEFSLIIGRNFQTIVCQMKGGSVFLEATALALFVKYFTSYYRCIRNLLPVHPEAMVTGFTEDMAVHTSHSSQVNQISDQHMTFKQLEELTVDLSQMSLILVAGDETGGLRKLQFEADFLLNLENRNRKFSFDLSRLSILSQTLQKVVKQESSEIQIPHFSSFLSRVPSSHSVPEDPAVALQNADSSNSVIDDASCSSPHVSLNESFVDTMIPELLHLSRQNYILKRLGVFVTVERPMLKEGDGSHSVDQGWIGSGAISGLDMTISLQEIQMVLSACVSLSEVSSNGASNNVGNMQWSQDRECDRSLNRMVPDGAVVAIQDVDKHMYVAVDSLEGKYTLVGAIHYSLVGERALFRVRYQNQKRWGSSALWFSLISLHAKSRTGEPLRLNYCKGSGFVDISCSSDDSKALWTTIACNSENEGEDVKPESYGFSTRNTFYFVNKKIDQAVAFIDEVPEFVTKPGNSFKWKVFHEFSLVHSVPLLDSHTGVSSSTSVHDSNVNQNRVSGQTGYLPRIDITVDKVIMTIVHELPDTKETFPLLQASLSTSEFVVQHLLSKVRAMSRLSFVMYYFDGQSNLWREFIEPVDMCVFYRSRLQIQSSRIDPHAVSVSFYAGMKEFGVSVTELSLDTLLFVIGTLNLAGPFAIKVSKILSNCCKVQNHCGLDLLCHFYENQEALVANRQESTIFLRHLAGMSQTLEASNVSIQLAQRGGYLTSPINLSLLEAVSLAWRTRIISTQDSKTYPGPFLIVDISRKSEEGLSISVSPLLRIYNETKFSLELRFRRPQQGTDEPVSVVLKRGETIDESVAAFDAVNLSGVLKKALMSLSVGNFLLSFRPQIQDDLASSKKPLSVEWSVDLKGGKTVRVSGVFDKLSYKIRKALSVRPVKFLFSTAHCSLKYEDGQVTDLHFLIQVTVREIPVILPDTYGDDVGAGNSPVAVKEQKEIFILPTFRITNLLQTEIHVLLTNMDPCATVGCGNIGNQATIPYGSTADLYADPATVYFAVTLTLFNSTCKPVNSGDCLRKLQKKNKEVAFLNVDLNFGGGKYFASLRMSRDHRGVMEVAVFTPYTLRNDTDLSLLCFASNQKPLSRNDVERLNLVIPPEVGLLLPPKSTKQWFMKHNKVRLKLLEEQASEVVLDLDALSGLAEISLQGEGISGSKHIMKLGLSLGQLSNKVEISQIVTMVPRYVILNESEEAIIVRQCDLEDDQEAIIEIQSKQKVALRLQSGSSKKEISVFEKLVYKHRNAHDDSSKFIQFRRNEAELGWSGPVCVASLGRFFLKFRRCSDISINRSYNTTPSRSSMTEFAAVHAVEENSSLVLHFYKPPDGKLPYRIENNSHQTIVTYYQKDSFHPESLGPGSTADYVWDDLTRPRRLILQIEGFTILREINLDKVRSWKPIHRVSQLRGLGSRVPLDKNPEDPKSTSFVKPVGQQMVNFGYEIYADGATRVLRFSDFHASFKRNALCPSKRIRMKVSSIKLNLLENTEQEMNTSETKLSTPILVGRVENVGLISLLSDKHKYNKMSVQSLSLDQRWVGAPFASMLRRHQTDTNYMNGDMLHIVIVLLASSSSVRQVKFSSVILQPLDINLDEETLMRLVPFWRTSLSDSKTPSQQYYFDHFEIHPIKIVANFLPGDSYSSYSSTQETLRTLLHSVIKIPAIKSKTVELNGVLVTHALITIKELFIKCAQHYSWYAMRAIYIAKGSPLLPPAFASIFDDLASSSLDAFFDPSTGLVNLPGLTIGTFKLLSKCIDGKGLSGTKRYLGDLGKTVKTAGSNILFAAVTEVSDSVLRGAEASGLNGMVSGFHQGVLKLAMEPSVLGAAFMEGGPDRKIMLDRSPGIDELYIEGYLQAMLDTTYKQEYLRVRVIDNQVFLKNLPPNSSLIEEIMDRVKSFLVSKALLKGDPSSSQPLRHLRGHTEWKIGPTLVTLCEHLFVSFAIRFLRKRASKLIVDMNLSAKFRNNDQKAIIPASSIKDKQKMSFTWKWGIGKFVFSGVLAYIDGRLCRSIPHPVARRIVSGFILSFLDSNDS